MSLLASFAAFDVETTGVDPERDRVIQLGAVRLEGGRVAARWSRLVDPGVPVPLAVQRLTGITPSRLAGQPSLEEVLPEFLDFAGNLPLVAHNAPFDTGFLAAGLRGIGRVLAGPVYDTLELARLALPAHGSYRLQALAEGLGLAPSAERYHDALADAEAAALLFHRLLEHLRTLDREALALAIRFLRPAGDRSTGSPSGGNPGGDHGAEPPLVRLLSRILAGPVSPDAPRRGGGGEPGVAPRPPARNRQPAPDFDPETMADWLAGPGFPSL